MTQLVSNIPWQNLNSLRKYPLNDAATCLPNATSMTTTRLPEGIVVDLNVWTPFSSDTRLFLGAVSVSANLVTITVAREVGGGFVPVAACTVPAPITVFRSYPLKPLVDGVAGWVAFGPGLGEVNAGNWSFSSYAQSGVLPRLVRSYAQEGVSSIARSGRANGLTGKVKLLSGDTDKLVVEVVKASSIDARTINGQRVNAAIIRLNEAGDEGFRVHSEVLSPCQMAPESGTCRRPTIFTINGVTPDCDGVIHFIVEELTDEILGPQLYLEAEDGRLTFNFETPVDTICERARAKNEYAVLVDPDCEPACVWVAPRPYFDYEPLYDTTSYGGAY